MYIVAAYKSSLYVELVISEIKDLGIPMEQILAIPLDRKNEGLMLTDTMHHADGHSLIDLATVLGTIFMLLGAIYGFVLPFGPIIWAFAGLIVGGLIGYIAKWIILKSKGYKLNSTKGQADLFIMIHCDESQERDIERICWNNNALGIGKLQN